MKTHVYCWAALWIGGLGVPALAHATHVPALVWFEPEDGRFAARTPAQRFAVDATGVRTADGAELHFRGARPRQGVLDPAGIFPLTRFTLLDGAGRRSATAAQGLRFSGIYPHVDLYYHFAGERLEYDLTLEPGARLADVRIAANQKWKLHGLGQQPVAWQSTSSGARHPVQVHYVRCGADTCFSASGYDPRLPLVIDPVISYASYLGSSGMDIVLAMQADAAGNLYVFGNFGSLGLPTATPAPSGFLSTNGPTFLVKFSPAGQLLYAVLPDLSYFSFPLRLAVDSNGGVYLIGSSYYGRTLDSPAWIQKYTNCLLIKIDAAGTDLIYRTYLPSTPTALLPDGNGNLYLAGAFAVQPLASAFRSASSVFAGQDSALVLLSADGTHLLSSTFLEYPADNVAALAIDAASGDVIAAGTSSATGPRQAGALQQFNAGTDMFRSLDTGAIWTPTGRDVAGAAKFQDLAVPRRLWAVSGTTLAVSTDFGVSWQGGLTLPASGSVLTVANVPDLLFLGSSAGLYESKDAGTTWSSALGNYSRIGSYAVDPQNPDNLFAYDSAGGSYSKDGGQSWHPAGRGLGVNLPVSNISLVTVAGSPTTLLIAGRAINGAPILVWFRFDLGQLLGGIPVSMPAADPSTPGRVLAISTANMLIESKDSGATFAQIGKPPATALGLAIDPQQPNTVYLYGLQFFRSTDGGRTWTALSGAPRPGTSTGNQLLVNPLNSSELLFIRTMTSDAFAARFTSDLTTLVFSTYLGGSADEIVSGMVMGTDGTLYINGHTFSTDFQMAYGSTSAIQSPGSDLFVMKLSGDGAGIAASAFFGGSQNDYPGSPALDNAGNLLFTGYTTSPDYPVTAGALGTQLSSTQNASFFTVLDPNLNLLFSTFLTLGNGSDTFTGALPIPDGRVWLAAAAGSTNLPVTANAVSAQPGGPANAYVMLLDWQH